MRFIMRRFVRLDVRTLRILAQMVADINWSANIYQVSQISRCRAAAAADAKCRIDTARPSPIYHCETVTYFDKVKAFPERARYSTPST